MADLLVRGHERMFRSAGQVRILERIPAPFSRVPNVDLSLPLYESLMEE